MTTVADPSYSTVLEYFFTVSPFTVHILNVEIDYINKMTLADGNRQARGKGKIHQSIWGSGRCTAEST